MYTARCAYISNARASVCNLRLGNRGRFLMSWKSSLRVRCNKHDDRNAGEFQQTWRKRMRSRQDLNSVLAGRGGWAEAPPPLSQESFPAVSVPGEGSGQRSRSHSRKRDFPLVSMTLEPWRMKEWHRKEGATDAPVHLVSSLRARSTERSA